MFKVYKFQDLVSPTRKVRGMKTDEYKDSGKYPVIDQGKDFIAGYSDNENALYKDTLPVVIFGDHTLAIKFVDFPFCAGADGTQILKPNKEIVIGRFLYYAILNLNIKSLGYSRHFKVLKESTFHIPEIEDQKRIVKILDRADALRQKRKQAISLLDAYSKSVFLETFGDLSKNPKKWKSGTISELVSEVKYGTSSVASSIGEFPYLRMNNITYSGELDISNLKYIDLKDNDKEKYLAKKGDLLFNRTNSKELVGKTTVYNLDVPMAIAGYLIRVRTNEKAIPEYVSGYLNSEHGKRTLENMCKSIVGMANINAKELQKIKILIPPVDLQIQYKNILEKKSNLKQKMFLQSEELETQFQALMQKAFRGEL